MTGSGTIRTVARTNSVFSVVGDLTNFTGTLRAETGRLVIGGVGSSGTNLKLHADAEIHVDPQGSVEFRSDNVVVKNDIFLHNAHGQDRFMGALTGGGSQTLAGRIDVGDQGSTIVGSFDIKGEFMGTNLTQRRGALGIRSPQRNLRGNLQLIDGGITLFEAGEFHGLDEIVLENGGRISLQPNANTDRIDDSTLIRSRSGSVSLKSRRDLRTSELLGTLRLERGRTSVFASSDHGSLTATLTINNIERERGTLLHFDEAGNVTNTQVNHVDTFEANSGQRMIGGWATTKQGFASIDENGFIGTLQTTSADLNTAGPSDHVGIAGNTVLDGDKAIASLQHNATGNPFTFDLNGHRLRIRSGGIFRSATIENGSLTAGDIGEDAELIVHQPTAISADIVDNSEAGRISFVMANDRFPTRLSGNNSYTGGTYVNGSGSVPSNEGNLTIESHEAIPENDRVFVNGGRYELRLAESGTANLAELHLSNNGSISGFNTSPIDAEMFFLEDGNLNAPITGDGSIFKDSDGIVSITNSESPNFTGQVVVRQGTLSLDPKDLPQATYQVSGGRLKLKGNQVNNELHLAGGTLEGGAISGDLFVDSDSTISGDGFGIGLFGRLIGDANLTIDGRLDDNYFNGLVGLFGDASNFHGNINVQSGPLQIGAPAQMGSGEISVQEGGRLVLGSQRNSPATHVDNTIHLYGGTLFSVPPGRLSRDEAQPSFATGDVFVHTEAFIGAIKNGKVNGQPTPGLTFAGRLILEDGANVYGLSRPSASFHNGDNPLLEISGQLLVGENTSWNLATASLLISGSISPSAAQSSIDFQGVESSLVLRDTEIMTITDKNLAVTINGSPVELSIQGAEAVITGSGQFTANVELTDGATISPGNSSGRLTIVGATIFGSGSIYEWEIASNSGAPGEAWDLLQVEGDLHFTATTESPWILQVSDLPGFLPGLAQPWLIASANSITGFDPAAVQVDITEITDVWPSLASGDFIIFTQTGNLFLQAVPEPTSCVLFGIGIVMLTTRCRFHRS